MVIFIIFEQHDSSFFNIRFNNFNIFLLIYSVSVMLV